MIDLDEIDLKPTPVGSAKKIRAGKKRAAKALAEHHEIVRKKGWRQELKNYNQKKKRSRS